MDLIAEINVATHRLSLADAEIAAGADIAQVSHRLGVSLRSVGSLATRVKIDGSEQAKTIATKLTNAIGDLALRLEASGLAERSLVAPVAPTTSDDESGPEAGPAPGVLVVRPALAEAEIGLVEAARADFVA